MIAIESLTKRFNQCAALEGLNLAIPAGEIFGFLGPNGAGKTTTIKLCTGLLRPTSGSVLIDQWDIQKNPRQAKKIIGYVSDQPFVYPLLTGVEFLRFMGDLYEVPRDHQRKKIPELIELFELSHAANDLIESYSHGMRQKIMLASMILHSPKVIFVDEPMVGLDPKTGRLVKKIFQELSNRGVSIFMSTHTLELAEKICHRIGVIVNGKLIAIGSIDDLRSTASREGNLEDVFLELTGGTEYGELLKYL
ncbi:MAG: ATP-binding cassette domain-containing protein [Elusimicrobia bacterium]|nr:ATP-binding cassette domain-containing protein [Elusimicrobiota bacterium]MBD3412679.1 ATP-binding cassette domain-containing protein [Elusimicrobiota bacterium]